MPIRRKAFWLGVGAGLGLVAALVLLQRRRAVAPPPLAVDQLAPAELLGDWYELAVRDPERQGEDRIGTRYQLLAETGDGGGFSLTGSYHAERFDTPRRECRTRLAHQPPSAKLLIGGRELWLLELGPESLVAASPDRGAVWILARGPELDAKAWEQLGARLSTHGVELTTLTRTPHL